MSDIIALTIPRHDEEALVAGATMLLTLAGKIPDMELDEAEPLGPTIAFLVEEPTPPGLIIGPFYWLHRESGSCGICATREELSMVGDGACAPVEEITADDIRLYAAAGCTIDNPHGLAIPEAEVPPPPIVGNAEAPAGPASSTPTDPASAGAATGASPSNVELDDEGLPHDMRIHARTKTKTANGHWKRNAGS